MLLVILPISRVFSVFKKESSLTIFHVTLPITFIINRSVLTVKIDTITIFLSVLPKTLKHNITFFIIFILKKNKFTDTIELTVVELSNVNVSLTRIWIVKHVDSHSMHFIVVPVTCVLIIIFESISAKTFFFSIF